MPTKQEMISDLAFKAWPFSYDFNFACKDGWVNTTTCKYYFPFVANSTITNCCKELCLKCGRVPRSLLSIFSYYFKMLSTLLKVIVFLFYLLQYAEVFLISLLDGCYSYLVFIMDPVNGCSKSKLLVKE